MNVARGVVVFVLAHLVMEGWATTALVQKKLQQGEICSAQISALLIEDWTREFRILALISKEDTSCVFVYKSSRIPVLGSQDLEIDAIVPISSSLQYKCEESQQLLVDTELKFRLLSRDTDLLFSADYSEDTDSFVAKLQGAQLVAQDKTSQDFSWANKYLPPDQSLSCPVDDPFGLAGLGFVNAGASPAQECTEDDDNPFATDQFNPSFLQRDEPSLRLGRAGTTKVTVPLTTTGRTSTIGENMSKQQHTIGMVMLERESEYANLRPIRILCGTFNTNGQSPPEHLRPWLSDGLDSPPDVYALGFQELDLSQGALLLKSQSAKESEWIHCIGSSLYPGVNYSRVRHERMVGVMIVVLIRADLMQHVSQVSSTQVPTGLLGMMGNKGGVGVRLRVFNTSLVFVSCHLAAHQDEVDRRNQDFQILSQTMKLPTTDDIKYMKLKEHDLLFWVGDLNYRVDIPYTEVRRLLKEENYAALLDKDQLTREKSNQKVFVGFHEPDITFPPTYKYDVGTSDFDSSEKRRIPAYTDRIQWSRGEKGRLLGVKALSYRSHMDVTVSDHKPVSSLFLAHVKEIDEVKYSLIYKSVLDQIDKLENDYLPHATLSTQEVNCGEIKFMHRERRKLEIKNTGKGAMEYEFKQNRGDAPDMKGMCQPWLDVQPSRGMLFKDETAVIDLEVYVTAEHARSFSESQTLSDILVLHLINGKDFFIMVRGEYQLSSFGLSLHTLIHLPQYVRDVPQQDIVRMEREPDSLREIPELPQPKEIYRLVDHIITEGLNHSQLFQVPGSQEDMAHIREVLDSGTPEKFMCHVNSVAEALLVFLQALRRPVIPAALFARCLEVSGSPHESFKVIEELPRQEARVFKYLVGFLKQTLEPAYCVNNGLTPQWLAATFGDVLLRRPPLTVRQKYDKKTLDNKKAAFLSHFLTRPYQNNLV